MLRISRLQPYKVCLFIFLTLVYSVVAATEKIDLRFGSVVVTEGDDCSHINIRGESLFHKAGLPLVPYRTMIVELPANAKDVSLVATVGETFSGTINLPPAFGKNPRSGENDGADDTIPDSKVYDLDAMYPSCDAEIVSLHRRRGALVAAIRVFPVRVNPVSLKYTAARRVSIDVKYSVPALRVKAATPAITDDSWRYMIVTAPSLTNAFEQFVVRKESEGTPVRVVTTAEIYAKYDGVDSPEKIRNCITDGYKNHGTKYVLLGGNSENVPARYGYGYVGGTTAQIPTDVYYACLDGSWDANTNAVYGEPNDGEDGGDVDLSPEVYVGRAPVGTASDVSNFIAKTERYMVHGNVKTADLFAEYLGFYDGVYAEGFRNLVVMEDTLAAYDRVWLDDSTDALHRRTWGMSAVKAKLNASPNLVLHTGHGNQTTTMSMGPSSLHSLTNEYPFILASCACLVGSFDYSGESFVEAVLNSSNAAAAAVLNTREGWFSPGYEFAYSGEFMYNFLKNAVSFEKTLGEAHFSSKDDMLADVETSGDMVYRWCFFESTLFGDPQLSLLQPDSMVVTQAVCTNIVFRDHMDTAAPFTFTIRNTVATPFEASIHISGPLLKPSAAYVSMPGLSKTNLYAEIDTEYLHELKPGAYKSVVTVCNDTSAHCTTNDVSILLLDPLTIRDSVLPLDDASLDFGTVTSGVTRTLSVTIGNPNDFADVPLDFCTRDSYLYSGGIASADILAYDATTGSFCEFSTDSPDVYRYSNMPVTGGLEILPGRESEVLLLCKINNVDKLVSLNINTGRISTVVSSATPSGSSEWAALSYSPWDRKLYGLATDETVSTFYVFDVDDGTMRELATISGCHNALAVDNTGTFFTINISESALCTVNPFNGDMHVVGSLGVDTCYRQSLDFDSAGDKLYWSANASGDEATLRLLDKTTARSVVIYQFDVIDGFGYPPEFEIAIYPDDSPFSLRGLSVPVTVPAAGSITFDMVFAPHNTNNYTSVFNFFSPGTTTSVASVICNGVSVHPSTISTEWLNKYGFPLDGTADVADTDGDGFSNYEEWICGTSPLDPAEKLLMTGAEPTIDGCRIAWQSIPGIKYSVQTAQSLSAEAFTNVYSVIAISTNSVFIDTRGFTNGFYKIKVVD